ncbi:MAG: diguanylate cyclase [Anaerolineales bacterium]|nr:diguanylate cyclase [Anaerolineales bacterium]
MLRNVRKANRSNQLLDPLTGVYSRASFDSRLQEEVARAQRYMLPFSLLIVDIDHFKSINDGFGHEIGDKALVEFANRLQEATRRGDLIFRLGGDEFVLLLPNTGKDEATRVAQRLLEAVRSKPFDTEPPITLTVSIGVSFFLHEGPTPSELMRTADRHAYLAKRLGRDRVVIEDAQEGGKLSFDDLSRLIERDEAQERLHRYLDSLKVHPRSVLRVTGKSGCGQTRFLAEVENLSRLHGLAVLKLRGSRALQARVYGALTEMQGMDGLPHPSAGVAAYSAILSKKVVDEGWAGLVMVVDDLRYVDHASLEFLHDLYFSNDLVQLALAYADDSDGVSLDFLHEVARPSLISLTPFSLQGVRLWLRHSLQWEAPQELVDWLYQETSGCPSRLKKLVELLIERELLSNEAGFWNLTPFFTRGYHFDWQLVGGAPKNNLPGRLSDFVGREAELRRLKSLLQEQRLVTLLGPGGLGKTRLAMQLAAECLPDYRDGVFFIPLAPLASTDHILTTLAEALQFSVKPSQDLRQELLAYLKPKKMLIILDAFEHLLEATPLLVEIIEQALGVRLVVASRRRLEPPVGVVMELEALAYPESGAESHPQTYAAVQLFLHDARRAAYQGSGREVDWLSVGRICRLVRGIPLGLELAAARVDTLSCREIADEIEQSLEFLLAERKTNSDGEPSLYAVLDAFWRTLSDYEQDVLRRLSVFRGGFNAQAAQQVAGASQFFLYALSAQSYLRRQAMDPVSSASSSRYETHLLLQQYALKRLQRSLPEERKTRLAHCKYYMAFLQERADRLHQDHRAQEEIRRELDNVRSAWRFAVENQLLDLVEQGLAGLSNFCAFTGLLREGLQVLESALECARDQHSIDPTPENSRVLGSLLVQQGRMYVLTADFPEAVKVAAEAEKLTQDRGVTALEAYAALVLGMAWMGRAEHDIARQCLQRGLTLAQRAGDRQIEADCLRNLGNVEFDVSPTEIPRQYYQQSLDLCRQIGDRRGEGASLNNLGIIAMDHDDYDEASRFFEADQQITREFRDILGEAGVLMNLAITETMKYHFVIARGYLERCFVLLEGAGARFDTLVALWAQAFLDLCQGDLETSRRRYEEVMLLSDEIGDRVSRERILMDVGLLNFRLGDYDRVNEIAEECAAAGRELKLDDVLGYGLTLLGHAQLVRGNMEEARQAFEESVQTWQRDNHANLTMEALAGMTQLELLRGNIPQALAQAEKILAYIQAQPLVGLMEPAYVYLVCCQALERAGDARLAQAVELSRAWLMERAELQESPAIKQIFLENIPANRELRYMIDSYLS